MFKNLSNNIFLVIFLGLVTLFIVFFILGIYFFKNKERIEKKYNIDYFLSFIFGAVLLSPFYATLGSFFSGDLKDSLAILLLIAPIYLILPIILCFRSSKGKPYRIRRIFIMVLFAASFFGFLVCKLAVNFWESAQRGTKEDPVEEYIRKSNQYFEREETEAYYRNLKGKF